MSREKTNAKGIWPYMTVCFTGLSVSSQTAVHVSESRKIRELYIVLKDVLRTYNAPGMNTEHKVCLEKCQKIRDEWRCMWPSLRKGLKQGQTQKKALIFFPYLNVELLLLIGERWRAIFLNKCPILPYKIKNRLKNTVDMIHFTDTLFSLKSVVISA